jgi:small-conductance mechanosensitive channel
MAELFPLFWGYLDKIFSFELIAIGKFTITPWKLVVSGLCFWFFVLLSQVVERTIRKSLALKGVHPDAKTPTERFARYAILMIGVIVVLAYLGVNTRSIETFGAVLGVGIGFGLQNITQNFISGIILLAEKPIKRGDIVILENGSAGRVLDIRARSTYVLTRDDIVVIVPNSDFITKQVVNESYTGDKIRQSVDVIVAFGTDTQLVRKILMDVANNHPHVMKALPPTVLLNAFGTSGMHFSLQVWISELWFNQTILSDLRFEIDRHFAENKIFVPVIAASIASHSSTKSMAKPS